MDMRDLRPTVVAALNDVEALRERLSGLLADIDRAVDSVQIKGQGRWTPQMLALLWEKVQHLAGIRALFEVTSEHPNEAITFTDVLARSELTEQQQRNEHARMSRVASELFGGKTWPIEAWQGSAGAEGDKAEMLYRMGGTVATWWIELIR